MSRAWKNGMEKQGFAMFRSDMDCLERKVLLRGAIAIRMTRHRDLRYMAETWKWLDKQQVHVYPKLIIYHIQINQYNPVSSTGYLGKTRQEIITASPEPPLSQVQIQLPYTSCLITNSVPIQESRPRCSYLSSLEYVHLVLRTNHHLGKGFFDSHWPCFNCHERPLSRPSDRSSHHQLNKSRIGKAFSHDNRPLEPI